MRTTFVSLVCVSSEALKTTIGGETSIGFQIVPVISSTTLDLPGSLQVTVADFVTLPSKLAELNWSGMTPVLPGLTCRSQVPAVVQPHPGRTSVSSSKVAPVLVNTKSCLTKRARADLAKIENLSGKFNSGAGGFRRARRRFCSRRRSGRFSLREARDDPSKRAGHNQQSDKSGLHRRVSWEPPRCFDKTPGCRGLEVGAGRRWDLPSCHRASALSARGSHGWLRR